MQNTHFKTIRQVRFYATEREAQTKIIQNQRVGWEMERIEPVDQGWGCTRTCCLGLIFLPLALAGKNKPRFKVVYKTIIDRTRKDLK